MATITASGLGSNLDVNGIVSQLMAVERQPVTALDTQEASYQSKLTAYGSIKGALSTFQTAAFSLSSASKFSVYEVSSGDSEIVTGSASSIATAGSYSLDVTRIAQSQKLASAGQSSLNNIIGGGTITFDFGAIGYDPGSGDTFINGKYTGASFSSSGSLRTVTIDSGATLDDVRDAINQANIGVRAEVVNDGSDTSPYRLVLSVTNPGAENSLKISSSGAAGLATLLNHDPTGTQNLSETVTAQDAAFTVNGLAVTKGSNTISDVIRGVTLTLKGEGETTLNVTTDTESVTSSVQAMVTAYNDLQKLLHDTSYVDLTTGERGILTGEGTVPAIQRQIRNVMNTAFDKAGASYTGLAQVGVSFQRDGTLAFDSVKFQNAVKTDYAGVTELFSYRKSDATDPATEGVAHRLDKMIGEMLDSDGLVAGRTDGIGKSLDGLEKRRERLERRLEDIEARYRKQFSALDSLVGQMLQTSNFLSQQLAGLAKST